MKKPKGMKRRDTDEEATAWLPRSPVERRSTEDKRAEDSSGYLNDGGVDRRKEPERRKSEERRDKWLRIDKWRSVSVFDED